MMPNLVRGTSFRGVLNYNEKGRDGEKGGQVVMGLGPMGKLGWSARDLAREFSYYRSMRPKAKEVVIHLSLSFPLLEKGQVQDLLPSLIPSYLRELRLDHHPYLVHKHTDTLHEHYHLTISRIGFDGSWWNATRDQTRAQIAAGVIERIYGLQETPRLNLRRNIERRLAELAENRLPKPGEIGYKLGPELPAPGKLGYKLGPELPAPGKLGYELGPELPAPGKLGYELGPELPAPGTLGYEYELEPELPRLGEIGYKLAPDLPKLGPRPGPKPKLDADGVMATIKQKLQSLPHGLTEREWILGARDLGLRLEPHITGEILQGFRVGLRDSASYKLSQVHRSLSWAAQTKDGRVHSTDLAAAEIRALCAPKETLDVTLARTRIESPEIGGHFLGIGPCPDLPAPGHLHLGPSEQQLPRLGGGLRWDWERDEPLPPPPGRLGLQVGLRVPSLVERLVSPRLLLAPALPAAGRFGYQLGPCHHLQLSLGRQKAPAPGKLGYRPWDSPRIGLALAVQGMSPALPRLGLHQWSRGAGRGPGPEPHLAIDNSWRLAPGRLGAHLGVTAPRLHAPAWGIPHHQTAPRYGTLLHYSIVAGRSVPALPLAGRPEPVGRYLSGSGLRGSAPKLEGLVPKILEVPKLEAPRLPKFGITPKIPEVPKLEAPDLPKLTPRPIHPAPKSVEVPKPKLPQLGQSTLIPRQPKLVISPKVVEVPKLEAPELPKLKIGPKIIFPAPKIVEAPKLPQPGQYSIGRFRKNKG